VSESQTSKRLKQLNRFFLPALVLGVYFIYFCRSALGVHFSPDEPMNMAYAWRLPLWQLMLAPFMPWQPFYRPLAGWVFVPMLKVFGLNPLPFHAVMLLVVFLNALMVYQLARLLEAGRRVSWLAAVVSCYHAGLKDLFYNTAFIYDALCCFFYLGALIYYLRVRRDGLGPTGCQLLVVSILYLFALDSKEMAVTLPAVMLLYEVVYKGFLWRRGHTLAWINGQGRCLGIFVCLTAVYVWGRVFRDGGLVHVAGYVPKISADRFWAFQLRAFSDLFEQWHWFDREQVMAVTAVMICIAWWNKRPVLRFTFLFLLLTPLPIEFLIGRGGACLYIPMVGWDIFICYVLVVAADRGTAYIISAVPKLQLVRLQYLSAPLLTLALFFWVSYNAQLKRDFVDPAMIDIAPRTWDTIQQLRSLNPRVRTGATVVFIDDPMGNFDMAHIADLYFHDVSVKVLLNRQTPLSSDQIAKADCVIDYRGGRLIQLR
jgi:hypothetical protein